MSLFDASPVGPPDRAVPTAPHHPPDQSAGSDRTAIETMDFLLSELPGCEIIRIYNLKSKNVWLGLLSLLRE